MIVEGVRAGQLRNGWTVYATPEGCADAVPTRLMVLRLADGSLRALLVNRGETLANPTLMRDTSSPAAVAAAQAVRQAEPSCNGNDIDFADGRVTSRSADLSPEVHGAFFAGSWQESWTFSMCGRLVEVPITFRADGEGGAHYEVHRNEARLIR
jgi:hypothetical protein